jgi:hypothetical protein
LLFVQRALCILNRFIVENTPSPEAIESLNLGPIERDLHVLPLSSSCHFNEHLGGVDEEFVDKNDSALILASASETHKQTSLNARTDIILTKQKIEQLKQATKRKYTKTLIRIWFVEDQIMITALFRPWEVNDTKQTCFILLSFISLVYVFMYLFVLFIYLFVCLYRQFLVYLILCFLWLWIAIFHFIFVFLRI